MRGQPQKLHRDLPTCTHNFVSGLVDLSPSRPHAGKCLVVGPSSFEGIDGASKVQTPIDFEQPGYLVCGNYLNRKLEQENGAQPKPTYIAKVHLRKNEEVLRPLGTEFSEACPTKHISPPPPDFFKVLPPSIDHGRVVTLLTGRNR